MTNDHPYEWVWMTTGRHGTPHAAALQAANPGLRIHTSAPPAGDTPDAYHLAWRNCDRNIRDWWRANKSAVATDHLIFAEYDVLCDIDVRTVIGLPRLREGIAGPSIMTAVAGARKYWPFRDIPRLPRVMQGLAIATAPLAVLLIHRAALDAILDPAYDEVFAADIFCEVRMPTVIRHAGFGVASLGLPQVHCTPYAQPPQNGIFHPVKSSVQ